MITASLSDLILHRRIGPLFIGQDIAEAREILSPVTELEKAWQPGRPMQAFEGGFFDFGDFEMHFSAAKGKALRADLFVVRPHVPKNWSRGWPPFLSFDAEGVEYDQEMMTTLKLLRHSDPVRGEKITILFLYKMGLGTAAIFHSNDDDDERAGVSFYQFETT